jgi:hypothetical protein
MAVPFKSRRLLVLAALTSLAAGCSLDVGTAPGGPVTTANPRTATYSPAFTPPVVINEMSVRDSGLFFLDLAVGTGDSVVVAADTVTGSTTRVRTLYRLWLPNGAQLDSVRTPAAPAVLALTRGSVIDGWRAGLQGMRVGGRRRLVMSPFWGYRGIALTDQFGNTIAPPNSILVFEVELVGITRT